MALGETLLGGIKNQVNKTTTGISNLLGGNNKNLYGTIAGLPYNSDAQVNDGQKRFLTKSPIPNMPKVGNLTYVYFNINPQAVNMIKKKQNKIKAWSQLLSDYYKANPYNSSLKILETETGTDDDDSFMGKVTNTINKVFDTGIDLINKGEEKVKKAIKPITDTVKGYAKKAKDFLFGESDENAKKTIVSMLDYIDTPSELKLLSGELSKYVKSVSRPSIKLNTSVLNQYNRKRLVYKNVEFPAIKISFHDVKDSPVQRFFFSYLKCINDTFLLKSKRSYDNGVLDNLPFNEDWGFNTDSGFMLIDRITVIEWWGDKVSAYNYNNPKISSIEMSQATLGDWNPQEISVSFEYEGLTTDLYDIPELEKVANDKDLSGYQKYVLGKSMIEDVAKLVQMNWVGSGNFFMDMGTAFIKGLVNAKGGERFDVLKSQAMDTIRKLGFAEQTNYFDTLKNDLTNYATGEAKVIFNTLDNPAGAVGLLVEQDKNQFGQFPINS